VHASVAVAPPLVQGRRSQWVAGSAIAAALAVVVLYIWDDALLAAPIIAVTGLTGPWVALATFSVLYGVASYGLALLAVRAYDRRAEGRPSGLADWLARQGEKRRTAWASRFLESGKVIGFVVSSFALGGIVTTWLIRYSGRRDGIERIAAVSCAIFGITFTAMYTGLAHAIFSI